MRLRRMKIMSNEKMVDEDNTQWDNCGWMSDETPAPPLISCDCSPLPLLQMYDHTGHTKNEARDMCGVVQHHQFTIIITITITVFLMRRRSHTLHKKNKKKKVPQCGTFLVPVWMGREWLRISNQFPPKTCFRMKSSDIFEVLQPRSKWIKISTSKSCNTQKIGYN